MDRSTKLPDNSNRSSLPAIPQDVQGVEGTKISSHHNVLAKKIKN
jgi:hypothetical protein